MLVSEVVHDLRLHVAGVTKEELNKLAATINAVQDTLTFTYPLGAIKQGIGLGIDDESLYVWGSSDAAKTAIVERGRNGTTAAVHEAGAVVEVNPRFPQGIMKRMLLTEIRSWEPKIYRPVVTNVTFGTSRTIDLGVGFEDAYGAISARIKTDDSNVDNWPELEIDTLIRGASSDEFTSGTAIAVTDNNYGYGEVQVTLAMPFDLDSFEDDDDIETMGMSANQADIAVLGAAARLIQTREARRGDTASQGEPRFKDEVPAGFSSSTASVLYRQRDKRLSEEVARLATLYPITAR